MKQFKSRFAIDEISVVHKTGLISLEDVDRMIKKHIIEYLDDEIYKPVEYNTAQKYVLKTALENLGEMNDEQYELIRNNLLDRFK